MKKSPFHPGCRVGGYRVLQRRTIGELNLDAVVLRHEQTGARHLHLACDDSNNVFAVGFRTPPPDSTGVAHILEHTVLCGSAKYPVRDPFFAMLKRSLNTFMNAMTAADWTLYPVASMNRKDFYNLMAIYLDATFFPLLRELDFQQEGHRLDFSDPDDPSSLTIKGVVFNEMKGAMADPSSLLGRRLNAALFPTTCYGRNSGGEPLEIPELSWEQLRAFHETYYHPSNSWFFTYGDLPLEEHLQRIDALALSRFEEAAVASAIPPEQRLSEPLRCVRTFPVGPAEDPADSSMVQLAWLTCPIEDTFERAATGILASLLLGNPAAPLYRALVESGLGRNLSPGTGYHDDYRDTFLAAGLQGTNPGQTPQIEALVLESLEQISREGFPAERVEAALHQYEFANREVTGDQYPYGLGLMMRLFGPWLHADDPFSPLELEENLSRLAEAAKDPGFFPGLIRRRLLDNPHRVTLTLQPDPEHAKREEQTFAEYLRRTAETLDEQAIGRIREDAAALQRSQESVPDTACLPTLELTDIAVTETEPPSREARTAGCNVSWFDQPTNGIGYLTVHFRTDGLEQNLRPYLPLFCALLPMIGAAGKDYLEMSRRITAATGGVRLGTTLLEDPDDLDLVHPVVELKGKALERNREPLCAILQDMLTAPDFSDLERLRTVIGQIRASLENSIPGAGHSFASRAAAATLTPAAALREEWSGMSQVQLIRRTSELDEGGLAGLADTFSGIAAVLLSAGRTAVAVTAEGRSHAGFAAPLEGLLAALPAHGSVRANGGDAFAATAQAIGWQHNLPVAYVTRVFRTVPYTHPEAPVLMVLSKLLRAEFLHREIREKGGAYGGLAGYNADGGLFSMLSYRDPHLERTLGVYREGIDWACRGDFSDEMVKEAILAVFAELDRPLSPGGRGYRAFYHRQQGLDQAMLQEFRDRALATDRAQLTRAAQAYLEQGYLQSSTGILAGEEMYRQASEVVKETGMQIRHLE